ncbi:MAG: hypothetical protein GOV02_02565 [Candidatus Aenigmarchaeota archaeon]|nr:hypothetical protein [Candidatus Aenigmarchaeota archaeon]
MAASAKTIKFEGSEPNVNGLPRSHLDLTRVSVEVSAVIYDMVLDSEYQHKNGFPNIYKISQELDVSFGTIKRYLDDEFRFECLEQHKLWLNSEKGKIYLEQNKDKMSEYHKQRREQNRDKMSKQAKDYYQQNKDAILRKQQNHYNQNKERISERRKELYNEDIEHRRKQSNLRRLVNYTRCNKGFRALADLERLMKGITYSPKEENNAIQNFIQGSCLIRGHFTLKKLGESPNSYKNSFNSIFNEDIFTNGESVTA